MRLFRPKAGAGWPFRFFLLAVLVTGSVAATAAVAGLLQVQNLVNDISFNKAIQSNAIKVPAAGAPQTILLIGSDHRVGEPFKLANTDTMLLVRLDASSSTINVMSLPRDLEVDIPGYGDQQAQRGLQRGRLEPADQDDPAERVPGVCPEPHHRRQFLRVRRPRQRDRLRLLRRRPSLLQPVAAGAEPRQLCVDQHPAGLSEAVRGQQRDQRGLVVRTLPSHRHRPRPGKRVSRTSSAGPRASTRSAGCCRTAIGCSASSASTRSPMRNSTASMVCSRCSTWSPTWRARARRSSRSRTRQRCCRAAARTRRPAR